MRYLNEQGFFRREFFKEYRPIVIVEGVLLIASAVSWMLTGNGLAIGTVLLLTVCLILTVWFFRYPVRVIPEGEGVAVSPADGKIVDIKGPEFDTDCGQNVHHVSIFLRIWDVHINRYPVSGHVVKRIYRRGHFHPAMFDKASEKNEQSIILIQSGQGLVKIRQIAGILARRIVCTANEGDRAVMGKSFGLIKFGSRVELSLPERYAIHVHTGQKIYAGETVIGKLADS